MNINILIFLCGLTASCFGTTIGFGGGIFAVPILVIAFGVKIQMAVCAVAVSLVPAAIVASLPNLRRKLVDFPTAVALEVPAIIGTMIGAKLTSILSVETLEYFFGAFLMLMAGRMWLNSRDFRPQKASIALWLNQIPPRFQRPIQGNIYSVGAWAAAVFGGSAGLMAGLFGIGGGFLKVPVMVQVFRMPPKVAVSTSMLTIVFTSLVSSLSHYSLGHLDSDLALPLSFGFVTGALLGNRFKHKISDQMTIRLIMVGLGLAGLSTLIHTYWG